MEIRDRKPEPDSPELTDPVAAESLPELELAVEQEIESKDGQVKKELQSPFQESLRRLRRDKRAMVSLTIILLFIILPIIGPTIYQHIGGPLQTGTSGIVGPDQYHGPYLNDLTGQDQGPSATHWLGTDAIGRDMMARLLQGMLISIVVALLVEVVDVVFGVSIGMLAGFFGGWIDQLLARFTDVMFAFPGLLFAILLSGIFGSEADVWFEHVPFLGQNGNARLIIVSIALAFVTWPFMARLVRGQTLQLREQQFVEAARTSGTTNLRIILKHILPNLISIVIITSTLNLSGTIIGEAGLSFLGLGVKIPGSSLGLMIFDASSSVETKPYEILLPTIVLAIIVLAFSFFGDGLRDAFDPRSKD